VQVRGGYVAPVEGVTFDVYLRAIVPIGALFSIVLWLGNTAYLYLSVSFIQMLKVGLNAEISRLLLLPQCSLRSVFQTFHPSTVGSCCS